MLKELLTRRNRPALVWILSSFVLLALGIVGLLGQKIPGVEEFVELALGVDGHYILLIALLAVFIEGIYIIGNIFPGTSLLAILAVLSQLESNWFFALVILTIFVGWTFAGLVNIIFAKNFRNELTPKTEDRYHLFFTWFPAFRSNHEVAQIIEGNSLLSVFLTSTRIKLFASIVGGVFLFILGLLIPVESISNEEGFVSAIVFALLSFAIGVLKIKRSGKEKPTVE